MREADRFIYAADTTTMQHESTGFWLSYAEEIEDNTTEETLDLPRNVVLHQTKSMKWHEGPVWDPGYTSVTPLTTRGILHSEPTHVGEASRQTTIGEEDIWTIMPQRTPVKASAEADRRMRGHGGLMERIYAIVYDEAQREHLSIHALKVRAAWSHEYDEETGVIIDVEIEGSAEQRFALWDRVSSQIEDLETSLRPDEHDFLTRCLSIIVNRR
jgi:hypothetical protein